MIFNSRKFVTIITGHSKSAFVKEGQGGGSLKSKQNRTGGGGVLACVYYLKKLGNLERTYFLNVP